MQRSTLSFLILTITALFFYVYGRSVFLLASHHLSTDIMLTYLSGKMLNAHTSGYSFNQAYLSAHHLKINIIPNLSPPFSTMIAAFISRYFSYQAFFMFYMAFTLVINIVALSRLYQHFFPHREAYSYVTTFAFIFANLLYMPTYMNTTFGQVALILNALTIFSYLAFKKKQPVRSGFLLALAINIKLFFGIFLIYFLAKKQYRAFFSLLLFSLLLALIPFFIYGKSIYTGYWTTLNNIEWYGINWNASWYGFFSRIFGEKSHRFHSVLYFPQFSKHIYHAIFLLYIASIYYFSRKNTNSSLTFAFTLSTMLLISPLGWSYYFPILITALLINVLAAESNRYYTPLICLLLFALFLSAMPFPLYRDAKTTSTLLISQGNFFFISLLLFNTVNLLLLLLPQEGNGTKILTKQFKVFIYSLCLLPSLIGMVNVATSLNKEPQQEKTTDALATINDLLPSPTHGE